MRQRTDIRNDELAFAVAVLYHTEGLSQARIAARLGLSGPMQVSRLLWHAEEAGFFKRPRLQAPSNFELSAEILRRLPKLRRVKVAQTHEALTPQHRIDAAASV